MRIPKELTPVFNWHHVVIVDGLLRVGKNVLALNYVERFGAQMQLIDEVKAKISVLVYNQKLHDAHNLMVLKTQYMYFVLLIHLVLVIVRRFCAGLFSWGGGDIANWDNMIACVAPPTQGSRANVSPG